MGELGALTSFVKICGVTSSVDARLVVAAGADAVGLIFADSPRRLDEGRASAIAENVAGLILRVGVFRNQNAAVIASVVDAVELDAVQVHGPLNPSLCQDLQARGVAVIKALSVGTDEFGTYDDAGVDAVLVDGAVPGSGAVHSWRDLGSRAWTRPLIVAGGLRAENVIEVLERTGAWGCDVATGVEERPGVKNPARVVEFVSNARRHFGEREEPGG